MNRPQQTREVHGAGTCLQNKTERRNPSPSVVVFPKAKRSFNFMVCGTQSEREGRGGVGGV